MKRLSVAILLTFSVLFILGGQERSSIAAKANVLKPITFPELNGIDIKDYDITFDVTTILRKTLPYKLFIDTGGIVKQSDFQPAGKPFTIITLTVAYTGN